MRIVLLLLPLFLLGCHQANEKIKVHYIESKHNKPKKVDHIKELLEAKKSN